MEYGVKVPEVCENIQNSVVKALETMTGLAVGPINILVQGVRFKEAEKPALEEENDSAEEFFDEEDFYVEEDMLTGKKDQKEQDV